MNNFEKNSPIKTCALKLNVQGKKIAGVNYPRSEKERFRLKSSREYQKSETSSGELAGGQSQVNGPSVSWKKVAVLATGVSIFSAVVILWIIISSFGPNMLHIQADISIKARDLDGENVLITVTHNGGDSIPGEFLFGAETGDGGFVEVNMNWPPRLNPGDVVSGVFVYGRNPKGKIIRIEMHYVSYYIIREVQIE